MSPRSNKNGASEVMNRTYPEPLATHELIVKDPSVFWDTLRRFHFTIGTKFMIPVIGGRELDLHVLYRETTKHGGYEKVVAEKKWREVGDVFNFSPTTTSASFVLRKHYLSLLFHYEEVHFFRLQGPLRNPRADTFDAGNSRPELDTVECSPKPIRDGPGRLIEANGTIEGKFDCGYLVSVRMGSEVFHGVLYHPNQQEKSAAVGDNATDVPCISDKRTWRSGRRSRKQRSRDPSYPKPNRSGYNFFFAEKHNMLKSLYSNKDREFTKIIGHSWTNLSPEEKKVYENIGLKDKERYKREMEEYKERLSIGQ